MHVPRRAVLSSYLCHLVQLVLLTDLIGYLVSRFALSFSPQLQPQMINVLFARALSLRNILTITLRSCSGLRIPSGFSYSRFSILGI